MQKEYPGFLQGGTEGGREGGKCTRGFYSPSRSLSQLTPFFPLPPSLPPPFPQVTTAQDVYGLESPGDCHAADGTVGRGRGGGREGGADFPLFLSESGGKEG